MDFDTFFRCYKSNFHSWHTSKLWICQYKKTIFHQGSCVFPDVILLWNYHSHKEKTIKLLPYYSFYGGHIPPRKIDSPFLAVRLKIIQSHQDFHLAAFPQKNSNFICQEVCNIPHWTYGYISSLQDINWLSASKKAWAVCI